MSGSRGGERLRCSVRASFSASALMAQRLVATVLLALQLAGQRLAVGEGVEPFLRRLLAIEGGGAAIVGGELAIGGGLRTALGRATALAGRPDDRVGAACRRGSSSSCSIAASSSDIAAARGSGGVVATPPAASRLSAIASRRSAAPSRSRAMSLRPRAACSRWRVERSRTSWLNSWACGSTPWARSRSLAA